MFRGNFYCVKKKNENTIPHKYLTEDINSEEIVVTFSENELQKQIKQNFG